MKKPLTLTKLPRKWRILISITLVPLIITGFYLAIYQSYSYKSWNLFAGISIIVVSIVVYRLLWIRPDLPGYKNLLLLVLLVMLVAIIIPVMMTLKSNYEHEEIDRNPAYAEARITGIEVENSRKSGKRYYATISYSFNGTTITQRLRDRERIYKAGEIIPIRFSVKYPEMFEVVSNEPPRVVFKTQ